MNGAGCDFFTGNRLGLNLKQSHIILFLMSGTFEKKIKIRKKWNFFLIFSTKSRLNDVKSQN
jgi:hypothetical protein